MRTKLLAVLILALAVQPAAAWADGPSGSKEDKKTKQVKCGEGSDTPAGRVYAADDGIEVCSDDNASPDGRIMASRDGQFISVDGDPSNGEDANGFVRVDSSGVTCGDASHTDSSAGPGGACGSLTDREGAQTSRQLMRLVG